MERIRLPVPLCSVCSFTHRGVSVRAKNVPKRWDTLTSPTEHRPVHVVFPSPVRWVPEVHPSSGDRAPEKRSPGTSFCPGWETQFTGGKASEPPAGKNRPYCPWRSRLPECVTPDWCLTGLSSAIACSSELEPRPTWRSVCVPISRNCEGLQQW